MYLGIDLGTSNSTIVGNDGGNIKVFKTPEGTEVLPSAVMIDKRGNLFVGKRAYDQAAFSPDNVQRGFKRLMGTSSVLTFAGTSRTMTPQEASAEVLKALVAQARMSAGDFPIDGTVITIPAAFNQMQSEATMSAAQSAGLERVALLQEPIAAALASISQSQNKSGQFLIYDLGGGTFDVAIVQCVAGNATVVGHAGINMLGGQDFDRSLLNSVVRPWLLNSFDLPEDFQKANSRLVRVARYRAEIAKIALSTQQVDRIFAEENQIGTKDRKGEDIYLDIEISRADLEKLILDDIDRTIELCRKIIMDCGYLSEDIDRVVLIGGPSQMPFVRERIGSQLGIRVDFNVDPMTAVGVGAAVYAESRDWSGTSAQPKKLRASTKTSGPIDIRFDYPSRTTESAIRIKVRSNAPIEEDALRIQVDTDCGWTSGQLPLAATTEINDVLLTRPGENRIRVSVFDEFGNMKEDCGAKLSVFKMGAAADGMPLMHNVAIKVVQGATGAESDKLHTIITKGTIVPKSGSERFLAARNFSSSDKSTLDFEVYQHPDDIDDPEHALQIGSFRLNPTHLDKFEVIRRGDDVFADWEIDENSLLKCTFRIPSIGKDYNLINMYVPAAGHKSFDGEDGYRVAASALASAQEDVDTLERALGSSVAKEISDMHRRLEKCRSDLRMSDDADSLRKIFEEARTVRQEVAQIRGKPENIKATLDAELQSFIESCSIDILPTLEASTNRRFHRLAGLARDALNRGTRQAVEDARHSINEMRAVIFSDLMKRTAFWNDLFLSVAEDRHLAVDKGKHDRLVSDGHQAISQNDLQLLRTTVWEMQENMIRGGEPSRVSTLAGLLRAHL